MAFDYSVMLSLSGKQVLIVGGGKVASRKMNSFCQSHAEIVMISPIFNDDIIRLSEKNNVSLIKREFDMKDIENYQPFIVCAATNNEKLNDEISMYCNSKNILINTITNPNHGNMIVQAMMQKDDYTVSISTNGKNPGFSKALKEYLEGYLDCRLDIAISIYNNIRDEVLTSVEDKSLRIEILRKLSLRDILVLIDKSDSNNIYELTKKVKEWLSLS